MNDDLISRQAAIDALGDMVMNWTDSEYELGQLNQWKEDRKAIIDLPSAQPEKTQLSGESTTKDSTFDCISRQAAIDALEEIDCSDGDGLSALKCDVVDDAVATIKALPHAQRINGRWEWKESDLSWWYECSECGESPLFDPYEHEVLTRFCPWCGAEMEMRGEEDAVD